MEIHTEKLIIDLEEKIMNSLKVGFSRVTITPMMGIGISGYYMTRIADGVLDDLGNQRYVS